MHHVKSRSEAYWQTYDIIMQIYLIGSIIILPMIIGEFLVEIGFIGSIYESKMPEFIVNIIYMYEVLLLFSIGIGAFIIWIPAIIIVIKFWKEWRVVIPALLLLMTIISLFFEKNTTVDTLAILGTATVLAAFTVGMEWLIMRFRKRAI